MKPGRTLANMNSEVFVDQELSWLERGRVLLSEAEDESLPLRERVQRLATFSSSLDQFYMRGVAALQRRARAGDGAAEADGISPSEKLARISTRAHELAEEQERCFLRTIRPQLASEGIVLIGPADTSTEQRGYLTKYFRERLLPVLTPLAIDAGQPFPYLGNRSLCLVASIRPTAPSVFPHTTLSVIHLPGQGMPRFIRVPDSARPHTFILLEDVLRLHLSTIYTGYDIVSSHAIRVTRDVSAGGAGGPGTRFEESSRDRRLGAPVRLQCDGDPPADVFNRLLAALDLSRADLFGGFAAFSDLPQLYAAVDLPRRADEPAAHPLATPSSSATAPVKPLGQHLLLDLFDCDAKIISSLQGVKASMLEAAERAQATVVQLVFHEFSPFGISGVVVIAESHLAIHTWPEHRYAAVDIFTCGDVLEPKVAAEYLAQLLGATQVSVVQLERGLLRPDINGSKPESSPST
jgi:S-adenosylmethionine decarboxylase proenzyme